MTTMITDTYPLRNPNNTARTNFEIKNRQLGFEGNVKMTLENGLEKLKEVMKVDDKYRSLDYTTDNKFKWGNTDLLDATIVGHLYEREISKQALTVLLQVIERNVTVLAYASGEDGGAQTDANVITTKLRSYFDAIRVASTPIHIPPLV